MPDFDFNSDDYLADTPQPVSLGDPSRVIVVPSGADVIGATYDDLSTRPPDRFDLNNLIDDAEPINPVPALGGSSAGGFGSEVTSDQLGGKGFLDDFFSSITDSLTKTAQNTVTAAGAKLNASIAKAGPKTATPAKATAAPSNLGLYFVGGAVVLILTLWLVFRSRD